MGEALASCKRARKLQGVSVSMRAALTKCLMLENCKPQKRIFDSSRGREVQDLGTTKFSIRESLVSASEILL